LFRRNFAKNFKSAIMLKLATAAIFVILTFYHTVAQTSLYFQSGNPGDTWSYTSTGADATALAESLSSLNFTSAPQSLVVGGNTSGGSCIDGGTGNGTSTPRTFTFDPVNISSSNQLSRTLTFRWGNRHPVCTGTGWDTGENLIFTPIHDGTSQAPITLAVGGNDAVFNIQNNTCTYTVPPCVNQFSFVVSITTNRRDELLFIDDVLLTTPGFNAPLVPVEVALDVCQNTLPFNWNGVNITQAGVYNATIANAQGCDSLIQLTLTVSQEFTQNVNLQVCNGEYPIVYNGQSISEPGTYTQNFTSSSGCDSIVLVSVSTIPSYFFSDNLKICESNLPFAYQGQLLSAGGEYTVTFTTQNGCDSIYFLELTVYPSPIVNISFSSTSVESSNPIVLVNNNTSQFTEWDWLVVGNNPQFTIDSVFSPSITLPSTPGTYEVQWYVANGLCVSTTTYIFTVLEPDFIWNITLPNVFSPNNDGVNDVLTIDYSDVELLEFVILNRWGQTVFTTIDENEFWNGKLFNIGDECPEGVYFYQLKLRNPQEEEKIFQQYIHLVKP
jgi:gliding motility-associated-like protein